ncbi:hypothetical protein CRE_09521 [Caenorhabditis remanei]|uniref:DUF38 domain-containing protein n=1 Tax=Caenorhabditis remanei TaxID=31234 RepID=E3MJ77_CAERE|nr:hypothetical protein CRE_09521 [Caenorhabditis remanei]
MVDPLSYPSLKLVLEYLEANKRFSLASRCSVISGIDKIIPLRIAALRFTDNEIVINEISFKFDDPFIVRETEEEAVERSLKSLKSGDILLDYERKYIKLTDVIYFKLSEDYTYKWIFSVRRLPEKITVNEAMRKLTSYLLGQREKITVGTVNILNTQQNVLRLPPNLKLRTQKLGVGKNDISHLSKILDIPSCLPMNIIGTTAWREAYFEDSFIQSSTEIRLVALKYINDYSAYWFPVVMRLQNKYVKMENLCFSGVRIRTIIKNMIDNRREVGNSVILDCSGERFLNRLLRKVKERFGGTVGTFKEIPENVVFVSDIVSIPLDFDKELIVHGFKNTCSDKKIRILLAVVGTGMVVPVEEKKVKKRSFRFPWFS